jgi:ubiquitin C-terminal hydrolase
LQENALLSHHSREDSFPDDVLLEVVDLHSQQQQQSPTIVAIAGIQNSGNTCYMGATIQVKKDTTCANIKL